MEFSDYRHILTHVYSALETDNLPRAREIIAEHEETFPAEVKQVREDVRKDYGVEL